MPVIDAMPNNSFALYTDFLQADDLFATDPTTANANMIAASVVAPHIVARPHSRKGKGAFLEFEGVTDPKGFRGEHIGSTRSFQITYAYSERSSALALIALFEEAFAAADARLVMKVRGVEGSIVEVVEVHEWNDEPRPGGITGLTFTTTKVSSDLTVIPAELDAALAIYRLTAHAPGVSSTSDILIAAVVLAASLSAPAPSVNVGSSLTGVQALATQMTMVAPAPSFIAGVTLSPPPSIFTKAAIAPVVTTIQDTYDSLYEENY